MIRRHGEGEMPGQSKTAWREWLEGRPWGNELSFAAGAQVAALVGASESSGGSTGGTARTCLKRTACAGSNWASSGRSTRSVEQNRMMRTEPRYVDHNMSFAR
jgi:hypothetical protein